MTAPTTTGQAIAAFIASRVGASPKYREALTYRLSKLEKDYPRELPLAAGSLELTLSSLQVGDETRHAIWTAWARMYRWLAGRYGTPNPMLQVRKPPVRQKAMPAFTESQVAHLLYAHQGKRRELALLLLILDTGARIGEVHNLTPPDVGPNTLILRGKTGAREVPISPDTSRALQLLGYTEAIWTGRRGPLTLHGMQLLIKRCLKRAGLRGGPHKLRHTFGRLYIAGGGDVFSLQRIMGHANIKTTERYLRADLTTVAHQHSQFSPVARLSPRNHQPQLLRLAD